MLNASAKGNLVFWDCKLDETGNFKKQDMSYDVEIDNRDRK